MEDDLFGFWFMQFDRWLSCAIKTENPGGDWEISAELALRKFLYFLRGLGERRQYQGVELSLSSSPPFPKRSVCTCVTTVITVYYHSKVRTQWTKSSECSGWVSRPQLGDFAQKLCPETGSALSQPTCPSPAPGISGPPAPAHQPRPKELRSAPTATPAS